MGAPLPAAPPCILQRRFPCTAGDRHGFPLRVRAPQRSVRFMGNFSWCMNLFIRFYLAPSPRVDGTDDRLSAGMDVDVFDCNLLLPLAAIALQGLDLSREGAQQLHCEAPIAVLLKERLG